jgi:TPR repeat protein
MLAVRPQAVIKGDTMKTTVLTLLIGLMLAVGGGVATVSYWQERTAAEGQTAAEERTAALEAIAAAVMRQSVSPCKEPDPAVLTTGSTSPFEDASAAYERAEYATAVRLFRPLAEQGNAEAQLKIADMYQQGGRLFYSPPCGEEVAKDDAEAAKWFRRAAEQGHPAAQFALGKMYEFGAGVPKDLTEAVKLYGKAADQGYAAAQAWLGTTYEAGIGVPQNDILAYKWLSLSNLSMAGLGKKDRDIVAARMTPEQLAEAQKLVRLYVDAFNANLREKGSAEEQLEMGRRYYLGTEVTQDFKEALKWFRLAADKGNAEALRFVGAMFHIGKGVAQDYREAAKWYRLAAQKGDAHAEDLLGDIFSEGGAGVTQDFKEAAKWHRLAAEHGNAESQLRFGYMNYNGQGVAQDYKQAMKWYRLAANQGNADAQFFLGVMYYQGQAAAQDYREAAKWWRLAAEQGQPRAQLSLGLQYYNGKEGVAQDYQYAYMWLSLAASKLEGALGEAMAKSRDGAAKEMTSAQVLAAQEMAKRCEESNYKKCDKIEANQFGSPVTSATMMKSEAGTYVVPVLINNAITLDFLVDSGASDVSIPADVVTTLMRTGTLKQSDFLDQKTYRLADGSTVPSQTFRIRSLKVGNKVIENVNGSVACRPLRSRIQQ